MKRTLIIISLLILLLSNSLFAQNGVWYFGKHAGIDFNVSPPVAILDGATNTQEGTAVCCNDKGEVLFYSDGFQVFNKSNVLMKNGNGLLGHFSAGVAALIYPFLDGTNKYYIFTTDHATSGNGLRYSVVDMDAESGMGEVTQKNKLLWAKVAEKMDITPHSNGTDQWLLAKETLSDRFVAFLISPSGITTTPVISKIGSVHSNQDEFPGCLQFSHDGTKVATTLYISGIYELFKFDNSTGTLSNHISIKMPKQDFAYGVEFSPDNSILYGSSRHVFSGLYQFDISVWDETAIKATRLELYGINQTHLFGALQLTPDGKIYMGKESSKYLGVIENPDMLGHACTFKFDGFYLGGNTGMVGLTRLFIPQSSCINSFEFEDFAKTDGINFIGSPTQVDDVIQLTDESPLQSSAIWKHEVLPVADGFETVFSFMMHNPHVGFLDGSIPGADGICFVLNYVPNGNHVVGDEGGGLGYGGLKNCLAIEFDTYNNYITNFKDSDGNHLGVFSAKDKEMKNYHGTSAEIATKTIPFNLRADSTKYFVRIDYKFTDDDLRIFIDTTGAFATPLLTIPNFKIKDHISLYDDLAAYVGITSATGTSWETHELLSWNFCSFTDYLYTSVEEEVETNKNLIYPNPVGEYLHFGESLLQERNAQLFIYDLKGKLVLKSNTISDEIFVGDLNKGYYLCVIKGNSRTISLPMIKK
jgi:Bacterial lectin/Secretion system C-terminal sorting domain